MCTVCGHIIRCIQYTQMVVTQAAILARHSIYGPLFSCITRQQHFLLITKLRYLKTYNLSCINMWISYIGIWCIYLGKIYKTLIYVYLLFENTFLCFIKCTKPIKSNFYLIEVNYCFNSFPNSNSSKNISPFSRLVIAFWTIFVGVIYRAISKNKHFSQRGRLNNINVI